MQGFGHITEVLDETRVYVTRIEQRTEFCKVFGEVCVGNGGSGNVDNRYPTRKQSMAEEVKGLAEELSFVDVERHIGVLEQCEHFFTVFDAVFELVREYLDVVEVYEAYLESKTNRRRAKLR